MNLFTFHRVPNVDKPHEFLQEEAQWPDILATHPTRDTLTQEEWEAIVERATKRCIPELDRADVLCDQIEEELKAEGLSISGPTGDEFLRRRNEKLTELGAIPAGITKSVLEVLKEQGFQEVLTPVVDEFTFRAPLTARDKETREMAKRYRAEAGPENLGVTNPQLSR